MQACHGAFRRPDTVFEISRYVLSWSLTISTQAQERDGPSPRVLELDAQLTHRSKAISMPCHAMPCTLTSCCSHSLLAHHVSLPCPLRLQSPKTQCFAQPLTKLSRSDFHCFQFSGRIAVVFKGFEVLDAQAGRLICRAILIVPRSHRLSQRRSCVAIRLDVHTSPWRTLR